MRQNPGEQRDCRASAAAYYDEPVVAAFHREYWGGDDIHIGLYATPGVSIAQASAAMTCYVIGRAGFHAGQKILDPACGFGGTLRHLARMGCIAVGRDIAPSCVARARERNREAGLDNVISVATGDLHAIDAEPDTFDGIICQESLIHSRNKPLAFDEFARVLRPGGTFALSDIIALKHGDLGEAARTALQRLQPAEAATLQTYIRHATEAGFEVRHHEQRPEDMKAHYDRLATSLQTAAPAPADHRFAAIASNIRAWQDAIAARQLSWGLLIARKQPAAEC